MCTLRGQKIYGIIPTNSKLKLLIFGGKQFTVLSLNNVSHDGDSEIFIRNMDPIICNDWLHSGVLISDNQIVLLSAHNVVQVKLKSVLLSYFSNYLFMSIVFSIVYPVLLNEIISVIFIYNLNNLH